MQKGAARKGHALKNARKLRSEKQKFGGGH